MTYPYPTEPYPTAVTAETLTLNLRRIGEHRQISPQLLHDARMLEPVLDRLTGAMLVRLQAYVMTEDLGAYDREASVDVPATWWDHAKQRIGENIAGDRHAQRLARWLRLDRVRTRTLTATLHVDEFRAYPDPPKVIAHELGRPVRMRYVEAEQYLRER